MSGFQDLDISIYIKNYGVENFVETGCYTGDGINHAMRYGLKAYSCDIDKRYAEYCKQRFSDAYVMHAHSIDFLNVILDVIPGKCLFWLDAHFPELTGGVSNNNEEFFPLIKELELLSKKPDIEKDVIIIDDIRVIISADNPIKQEFDDKYKIYGTTIKQLTNLFPNHDNEIRDFQEGLLIFTPKV